jgi:hypothetical protein
MYRQTTGCRNDLDSHVCPLVHTLRAKGIDACELCGLRCARGKIAANQDKAGYKAGTTQDPRG